MKLLLIIAFSLLFFTSCISVNTTRQVNNFRLETDEWTGDEYFLFKSNLSSGQTELSLRKQFSVSEDEKINSFERKLFEDLDVVFNIRVDIDTDRNKYIDFFPTILNSDDPEMVNGKLETFVKIEVFDPNGENCLSRKSLFSNKTKSFLINIKNNIKEQNYINISSN